MPIIIDAVFSDISEIVRTGVYLTILECLRAPRRFHRTARSEVLCFSPNVSNFSTNEVVERKSSRFVLEVWTQRRLWAQWEHFSTLYAPPTLHDIDLYRRFMPLCAPWWHEPSMSALMIYVRVPQSEFEMIWWYIEMYSSSTGDMRYSPTMICPLNMKNAWRFRLFHKAIARS